MSYISNEEKDAIFTFMASLFLGLVALAFISWMVLAGHLEYGNADAQIEQQRIESYQKGYEAGSRNCVESYNQAWGE